MAFFPTLLLVCLQILCPSASPLVRVDIVDKQSWLVQAASRERWAAGEFCESLRLYVNVTNIELVLSFGRALSAEGRQEAALKLYSCVVSADAGNIEAHYLEGVARMLQGDVQGSAASYNAALSLHPTHLKARLNIATLHHRYGRVADAVVQYVIGLEHCAALRPHTSPTSQHPEIGDELTSLEGKMRSNLALAYLQVGRLRDGKEILEAALGEHWRAALRSGCCSSDGTSSSNNMNNSNSNSNNNILGASLAEHIAARWPQPGPLASPICLEHHASAASTMTHLLHIREAACDWRGAEVAHHFVLAAAVHAVRGTGLLEGAYTPFDALVHDVPQDVRLLLARGASRRIAPAPPLHQALPHCTASPLSSSLPPSRPLRLGFLSFDFNDHPTAHLLEGLFAHAARSPRWSAGGLELLTYSYGKDDGSEYRRRIERLSTRFVDVGEMSHAQAAGVAAHDCLDVLLEMQGHTLGQRLEIAAARPAATQVSYLVYPGTSGATFIDNMVADCVVLPPEHARHYSEGLLLVPASYQISFYDRHLQSDEQSQLSRVQLRLRNSLPAEPGAIVLCNFNKADKIDLPSLHVWFNILARLPRASLWLLQPAKALGDTLDVTDHNGLAESNIRALALLRGVAPHRIVFAPRVSKAEHVARHAAADLFLDSFTYGAHSTATDALRGGLVVLSVPGGSFPSRVAASLYASLCSGGATPSSPLSAPLRLCTALSLLLPSTARQFEDAAVALGRSPPLLGALRASLLEATASGRGIFHPSGGAENFLLCMQALVNAKASAAAAWARVNLLSSLSPPISPAS